LDILFLQVVGVSAALCLVLGANNVATCLGTAMSSRAIRYRHAVLVASVGLMAGVILEGGKLSSAVTDGVAPGTGLEALLAAALCSFTIIAFLTWLRLPISMTQVFVGAVVGATCERGGIVDFWFTGLVVTSWLLTPIAGVAAAILISLATRAAAQRIRRVILLNKAYTWLTVASGFYSSYVLGANGVGLVAGASGASPQVRPWVALGFGIATVAGIVIFGRRTTRSVAENLVGLNMPAAMAAQLGGAMVVHGFTQVGMPVSISQAVVGGIFGPPALRKLVVRNSRLVRQLILWWTAAPLAAAIIAFGLAKVL
jgi:PiT family inorganic phosphate transporter